MNSENDTPSVLTNIHPVLLPLYEAATVSVKEAILFQYPLDVVGTETARMKIPKTKIEAVEHFKIGADWYCEFFKSEFLQIYRSWSTQAVQTHLQLLKAWIENAKLQDYIEACTSTNYKRAKAEFVYLRWVNGFYDGVELKEIPDPLGHEAQVYGKYVTFYRFLESLSTSSTQVNVSFSPLLSNPSKALFCRLVNETKMLVQGTEESVVKFCKRVCNHYRIPCPDNVRQSFTYFDPPKERNIRQVRELILPLIEEETRTKIELWLLDFSQP